MPTSSAGHRTPGGKIPGTTFALVARLMIPAGECRKRGQLRRPLGSCGLLRPSCARNAKLQPFFGQFDRWNDRLVKESRTKKYFFSGRRSQKLEALEKLTESN
jgi:hypothetical protein